MSDCYVMCMPSAGVFVTLRSPSNVLAHEWRETAALSQCEMRVRKAEADSGQRKAAWRAISDQRLPS